jgi:RimJ/RimL family protein N-acetyltransferase
VQDAPYRIVTERLVLRSYDPTDAPLLKAAIDGSLEHLRAWMPWAYDDPAPLGQMAERLRRFRANFDPAREVAALLKAGVVVAADPGELGDLFTTQSGDAAEGGVRQADVGRLQLGTATA